LKVGQKLVSGPESQPEIVIHCRLRIPLGTVISCIELRPGQGAVISFCWNICSINGKRREYATIKMPSGETRLILLTCAATIELFLIQTTN
jgi:large subunit ribosomal protein L2